MKAKPKKKTIPQIVLKFLKKKKIAVTKNVICNATDLDIGSVCYACRILRKKGLIGLACRSYNRITGKYKIYWGIK